MEQLKRNDSLFNEESTRTFISNLGTKISYINACISSIKIEIMKYEKQQIDEKELRENVDRVLERITKEVKES